MPRDEAALRPRALRAGWIAGLVAFVAAGCAVGPDYRRPRVIVDASYQNAAAAGVSESQALSQWWDVFADPQLTQLVRDSAAANHDLRVAAANLRQARALLLEARYDYYPTVPAAGGYERQRLSQVSSFGGDHDRDFFFAGFDATWELDVFGRVRRSVEARRAQVGAAEAVRQDVLVSVLAEVARNYFELRGAQDRLAVARRNAQNQTVTYQLTVSLLEGGRGTDLDTQRARAQLESTRATVPSLEADVERIVYRLGVLTGRPPGALASSLSQAAPLPQLPAAVAVGNPVDLLRRRPDVRVAERDLAAATARVGVATADLFPRITLVGSIGAEASQFPDLFRGGADTYSFGPRLTWAAFDLGRVRARLRGARAQADAELARFERAVLVALEETDGALVAYSKELRRLDHLRAAEDASRRASELARQRYETGGIGDFLTVLDAERRTLEAQDELSQSRTRTATRLVAIFKSLGGGWEQPPPAVAGVSP